MKGDTKWRAANILTRVHTYVRRYLRESSLSESGQWKKRKEKREERKGGGGGGGGKLVRSRIRQYTFWLPLRGKQWRVICQDQPLSAAMTAQGYPYPRRVPLNWISA